MICSARSRSAGDPRTSEERERDRVRDDVYAFDENFKQRHLWKIAVSSGAETQLTTGERSVIEYRLSADGKRIAMARAPSPLEADAGRSEVWLMDASGENARAVTNNAVGETNVELSPDNSQLLFISDSNERLEPYYQTSLFVVARTWDPVHKHFGALPFIYGTAVSSLIALVIAAPLSIAIGLYLSELAPRGVRGIIGSLVETLAAIPSVIIGLWGFVVLAPFLLFHVDPALHSAFGFIPLFGTATEGSNTLST